MTAPDGGEREEILAEMAALARKLDPDPAAQVHEEIAGLREEIASLRQQLAAHQYGCIHNTCWHYPYYGTVTVYPQTWTTGTIASGTGNVAYGTGGVVT